MNFTQLHVHVHSSLDSATVMSDVGSASNDPGTSQSPAPALALDLDLASIDVVGLYLHIPHEEGIKTAIDHLYHPTNEEPPPFPPQVAKELLSIVLKHNYFEFNGNIYTQLQGTAMVTKMASTYANGHHRNCLLNRPYNKTLPMEKIHRRYTDHLARNT